uniref:CCHC-type domain-containing protein n=1 Tax=Lactuca sativa TaxID=4236 RepID=A0A9R1WWN5_LACSA|nr:hypothetical protein LSAT_V11C800447780 [Lactuca sativa]
MCTIGCCIILKPITKLTEKARFAEFYISTEERRVEHHIWGLRTTIREFVQIQKTGTFQSAVDAAEGRERQKNRQIEDRALGKRKWDGTNNDSKKSKNSGQEHKGECNMNKKVCYNCGKPGHIATECKTGRVCYGCCSPNHIKSECPQSKGRNNQGRIIDNRSADKKADTSRPKARAFRMAAQEAQETLDGVTGDFDVIGMDWLLKNQAIIDCENRIVQVWVPGKGMVKIYGDRRAYVLDAKQDKPEITHIPVVREFQDVFPDDLTNLPPDRQVEVRIDLTPGVTPIARVPIG